MPFRDGNGDDDGGGGRNNSYDSSLENFNYVLDILLCPSYQPYEAGFFPWLYLTDEKTRHMEV